MNKPNALKLLSLCLLASGLVLAGCGGGSSSSSAVASSTPNPTSSTTTTSEGSSSSSATATSSVSATSSATTSSSPATTSSTASSSSEIKEVSISLTGGNSVVMEKSITLSATVENAADTSVNWLSGDPTIATVEAGVVTGIAPGSVEITATAVADPTKSASLSITVLDKYAYRASANGTQTVEAESLDLSQFVVRPDVAATGKTAEQCIEDATDASGGKSIGAIGKGTILSYQFLLEKSAVVESIVRLADYGDTYDVDACLEFKIDDTVITSGGYTSFGHTETNLYWNWKDVSLGKLILAAGAHSFTFTAKSAGINLDCLKQIVSDYGDTDQYFLINANGTTTAEAENLDLADFVVRPDIAATGKTAEQCIEDATDASNGKSIGGIGAGTLFKVPFVLGDEAIVESVARLADYGDTYDVDACLEFKIDDTVITSGGYTSFGHTETNLYWNWKDVSLGALTLKKGFHTLTMKAKNSGINLDCFKLITTYYGDVASAGVQITGNGTTTLEAETMKVTNGSYKAETPSGDALALTSGGASIGNVATGTVFAINFNLGDKATVELQAILSKYEDTFDLDDQVTIALDGATLKTGVTAFGHTEDNLYWNWKTITLSSGILAKGMHTLTLTATKSFPNMDCVKIVVSGYGADFAANATGDYTIEAENVNKANLTFDTAGEAGCIESDAHDSNGKSLGHVAGGYFEISFYLAQASSVVITEVLSKYESWVIGTSFANQIDGTDVAFVDPTATLGRASDGSNDWFNWKDCALVSQNLAAGNHVLRFNYTAGGGNVDCIRFGVTFSA